MDFSNNFLVKLLNTNHRNKKYTDLIGNLFFMEENPDDDKILLSDLETSSQKKSHTALLVSPLQCFSMSTSPLAVNTKKLSNIMCRL